MFGQFSLAGNIGNPRFSGGGNHISEEKRDKEQERAREKRQGNLRNLCEEILQRSRGRRRKENSNENQGEICKLTCKFVAIV